MAAKNSASKDTITANMGSPNSEPQWKFFLSTAKYTCYGGARGGGKSWAIVRKAAMGAYNYPGIQIIMLRREYDQMENPIITPMLQILAPGTYK
jgi:phage terminase large subunit